MLEGKNRVLVIEDDIVQSTLVSKMLESHGFFPVTCNNPDDAVRMLDDTIAVVLLDLRMPKVSGIELLPKIKKKAPYTPVVVSSGEKLDKAVESIRGGAAWFLQKPYSAPQLTAVLKTVLQSFVGLDPVECNEEIRCAGLVGEAESTQRLFRFAKKAALSDCTVFVTGESGTGKTALARFIHENSNRAPKPFVSISCAALPRDLLEAELFGYEKGAFTGAVSAKPGLAEVANGGTLFLDEIGDLPLELQPKLLTFLQDQMLARIGSNVRRKGDVRIIAATWQDLDAMCRRRTFREDLYYRLMVLPLQVAPLRERRDDIPILVQHIMASINERREPSLDKLSLSSDAMNKLFSYTWPGNIRELANVLQRAAVLVEGSVITSHEIVLGTLAGPTRYQAESQVEENMTSEMDSVFEKLTIDEAITLEEVEKRAVVQALAAVGWNRAAAARMLGISERGLYNKIRKFGLKPNVQ
jgi:two-component system response regulator AtoC